MLEVEEEYETLEAEASIPTETTENVLETTKRI